VHGGFTWPAWGSCSDLVPTVAGGDSRQDSRGIGDRAGKITCREDAKKNEGPGYPPETLSRWTPAVSTRCSELASRASLSSPRSETDGRQVAASPRAVDGAGSSPAPSSPP